MLSLTLRGLERDGSSPARSSPPCRPASITLTALGRSLWEPVEALGAWAHRHHPEIEAAQRRYDADA